MAITTNAICNSFKKELLEGAHKFQFTSGSTFKLALYNSNAVLGASTTNYATNPGGGSNTEVANTGTYVAGGLALVKPNPSTSMASATAIVDFSNLSFTSVSLTARGALIYNTTTSGGSNTTYLSKYQEGMLLHGVLAECFRYLKGPQDMLQLYESKYKEELQNFALQQMGRRRRGEYDDGVPRIVIPSPSPNQTGS